MSPHALNLMTSPSVTYLSGFLFCFPLLPLRAHAITHLNNTELFPYFKEIKYIYLVYLVTSAKSIL